METINFKQSAGLRATAFRSFRQGPCAGATLRGGGFPMLSDGLAITGLSATITNTTGDILMRTYTLNPFGQNSLRALVAATVKGPLTADAYFSDAEEEADSAFNAGRSAVIEVRGSDSRSGNPETITLSREWFDGQDVSA